MNPKDRTSRGQRLLTGLLAAVLLAGCSSAPRQFSPRLAAPPADAGRFEQAHADCRQQVATGKREAFASSRGTAAGVGVAVGTGLAAASSAGASSSMVASIAATTAAAAALFIVAPLAILATSRYIRAGKEAEIRQALDDCLAANGYPVSSWELRAD